MSDEPFVLETCRSLLSDAVIDKVVKAVIAQNKIDEDSPELIRLRDEIKGSATVESGLPRQTLKHRLQRFFK